MKRFQFLIAGAPALAAVLLVSCGSSTTASSGEASRPPYASKEPMPEPTVFAEGVVSTGDYESHPAFTPDGRTLYFLKNSPTFNFWTIVVTHFKNNNLWSTPEVASFSGQYRDADPFITSDGSKFYFISDRPKAVPNIKEEERSLDIWLMEKVRNGWSAPKNLGAPVNSSGNEWYPTVALDGTLFFGSDRAEGKGGTDIYRSRLVNGKYMEPENLGDAINTQFDEFEPYIAPDQSYLIFMAVRPDGRGGSDLYISHQRGGAWTKAVNLGDKINSNGSEYSPKVSPDGKYFFWSSTRGFTSTSQTKRLTYAELLTKLRSPRNGLGDIYQIDISTLNIQR
ncbi:MAG: TolB family protein [Pyrinomonadaceae bacterium]